MAAGSRTAGAGSPPHLDESGPAIGEVFTHGLVIQQLSDRSVALCHLGERHTHTHTHMHGLAC